MQSKPSVKMMPTSSLLDPYFSTMDHKPLHQDQLSSTYSSPQLEAGKFLARVFKESKILAAAKKPAKVPTKIKHQNSAQRKNPNCPTLLPLIIWTTTLHLHILQIKEQDFF